MEKARADEITKIRAIEKRIKEELRLPKEHFISVDTSTTITLYFEFYIDENEFYLNTEGIKSILMRELLKSVVLSEVRISGEHGHVAATYTIRT